jgi:hypothetical protein
VTNGLDALWLRADFGIHGNSFKDCSKRGVYLYETNPIMSFNTFDHCKRGIRAIYSRATITNGTFRDNGISVDITSESDLYFADNDVMHGNYTIFSTMSSCTLVNNTIRNSNMYSLNLTNGSYAKLIDNKINGNEKRGVYFSKSDGWLINNSITDSGTGIYGFKADLTFERNTMYGNDVGIWLNDTKVTLKGDTLRDNNIYGLMAIGTFLQMEDALIHGNEIGVYYQYGKVWMKNCTVHNNTKGVWANVGITLSVTWSDINYNEEGLYTSYAALYVKGSDFLNNTYGIKAVGSPVRVFQCTFLKGANGINIETNNLTVADCRFELLNGTAISAFSGVVSVTSSELWDNRVGLDTNDVNLTVQDCVIRGHNESGIMTSDTHLELKDTKVIKNMDGLIDLGGSIINITDCNISSNEMFGVYTDQNTPFVTMQITRKIILVDNAFLLAGDLVIEDGGYLVLLRVPYEFYSPEAGDSGITVKTGGRLKVDESLLSSYEDWSGYHFRAESGSDLTILNCTVRHIGRGMTGLDTGLRVETIYTHVADTYFENNSVGLYIIGVNFAGHDLRFKDNRIGFRARDGHVDLVNSSAEGSTEWDLVLERSTADLLNSHIIYSKADVKDENSILTVKWYLHVSVIWDDGQPVGDAQVVITDKASSVISARTDPQGFVRWLVVREYQQKGPDEGNYFAFSPHSINVTERDLSVERSEYIGISTTIVVTMEDKTPPTIVVTSPDSGTVHYDSVLLMLGTASDAGSSVVLVEVSIDGKIWYEANGTSFWNANLTVPQGRHTLQARATDGRGNVGSVNVIIEIDLTSALLEIYQPINGLVTNASMVEVQGKVHTGSQLLINDENVLIEPDGNFTYKFDLVEGENLLHAKALAKNGLEVMEVDLVVIMDTTPPEIQLVHPKAGALLNRSIVTLSVTSNEDATFYVGANKVEAYGNVVDINIELAEGMNVVKVTAVDRAGNMNLTNFTFELDVTPPELELVTPGNPVFSTTKERIPIFGRTEPGSNLTINGEVVTVEPDGNFTVKQKLKFGKNIITIRSTDKANNTSELTLEVRRNQEIDNSNYMWLLALAVIVVAAMDVAIIMYFKKYYRPPEGKAAARDEDDELDDDELDDEPDDLDEEYDEEMDAGRDDEPRAKGPRRPKQVSEGPEFDEVEDLGEF